MTEVIDYQRAELDQSQVRDQAPGSFLTSSASAPVQFTVSSVSREVRASIAGLAEQRDQASEHVTTELVEGLPLGLVRAYAQRAAFHSRLREVDPGVWVATVVGLDGAYGDGGGPRQACDDLAESIIGWVAVRRRLGLAIPPMEGLDLNVPGARPGAA